MTCYEDTYSGVPTTHLNEYLRDLDLGYFPEMETFDYETYRRRIKKANRVAFENDRLVILGDGCRLRKTPPGQPTVDDLVHHGDIIKLVSPRIPPRRYIVERKIKETVFGVECFSFRMVNEKATIHPNDRHKFAYAGDYVAQDGKIFHLFERNKERVVVVEKSKSPIYVQKLIWEMTG